MTPGGTRLAYGALLKLPHKVRIDRILERRYGGLPELHHAWISVPGGQRAEQSEAQRPLGMIEREALGDRGAHGMAGNDRSTDTELVHEARHVADKVAWSVVLRGGAPGITMAPLGEGECVNRRG
jgi:hypothetical protein